MRLIDADAVLDMMNSQMDMNFFGKSFRDGYFGGKKTGLLLAIEEVKGGGVDG